LKIEVHLQLRTLVKIFLKSSLDIDRYLSYIHGTHKQSFAAFIHLCGGKLDQITLAAAKPTKENK